MNYVGLLRNIEEVALNISTVSSFYDGDVYSNWNNSEVRYGSVNVGLESTTRTENTVIYNVVIYYADRLLQDKSNKNGIWTDATNTITSIINGIDNSITYEGPLNIVPFEQKFADYLSGGYARVGLEVEFDLGECDLEDQKYVVPTLFITHNGAYSVENYEIADVNIPVPSLTELDVTENGTYTARNYDGYSTVNVNVPEQKPEEILTQTIYNNGTQEFNPSNGKVFSKAVITTDVKTYQEEYNEALVQINQYRDDISGLNNQITSLNGQITNLNAEIGRKEAEIADLESDIAYKDGQIEQRDARITQLTQEKNQLITEKEQLNLEIQQLNQTIAAKQYQIDQLQAKIDNMTTLEVVNNGTYRPRGGNIGWNEVKVNVSTQKPEDDLIETLTDNDTYTFDPVEGHAFGHVEITTDIYTYEQEYEEQLERANHLQDEIDTITTLEATENNQTYTPEEGVLGWDEVQVHIPTEHGSESVTTISNTTVTVTPSVQGSLLEDATVNITVPTQTKTYNVTQNHSTLNVEPDQNKLLSGATVNFDYTINNQDKTVTTNNTTVSADQGYDGLGEVTVSLPMQSKTGNDKVTTIQDTTITPDNGYEGLSAVQVHIPTEMIQTPIISQNGTTTYYPSQDTLADSVEVTVDVRPPLQAKTATRDGQSITPDNDYYGLSRVDVSIDKEQPIVDVSTILDRTISITPETQGKLIDQATVNITVPKETVTESYTLLGHNDIHTITPTQGKLIDSATLTLDYTPNNQDLTDANKITNNGTYTAGSGYDGLGTIEVDVDTAKPTETLTATIGTNGGRVQRFTPTTGYVYDEALITVDVSGELETESVTSASGNGQTYTPSSGNIGFSSFEVNIPEESLTDTVGSGTHHYEPTTGSLINSVDITVDVSSELQTKEATTNKTTVTPDNGKIGLSSVSVNIPEEELTRNVTQNHSTLVITPETAGELIKSATVNFDYTINNQDKTVTTNNTTVSADQGYDGLGEVVVDLDIDPITVDATDIGQTITAVSQNLEGFSQVTVDIDTETLSETIMTGGQHVFTPQTADFFDEAVINVPLSTKTVTRDGQTYVASDDSQAGYSSVTVNVDKESPVENVSTISNTTVTITPQTSGKLIDQATVNITVPSENKTESYTLQGHNDQHTFSATSGYLMATDTITLDYNPSLLNRTTQGNNPITSNGTYTAGAGYDGFGTIEVDVPERKDEDVLTATIGTDGGRTQTFNPTTGHVFSQANITVDVSSELESGSVTSSSGNGQTYTPGQDKIGFSSFEVNIPVDSLQPSTITANDTYTYTPTSGHLFSGASITVNVQPNLESSVDDYTIDNNGSIVVTPSLGYDGLSDVEVTASSALQDKVVTQNGIIHCDNGYFGLNDVEVAVTVPQTVTLTQAEYDALPVKDPNTYYAITDAVGQSLTDTITQNGTITYTPTGNYKFLSDVEVTVAVPETILGHLTETVTPSSSTQTFNFTPGTGLDGWQDAAITVNVPLAEKTTSGVGKITANGTYQASSDNVLGYSEVEVDVPLGTKTVTANRTTYTASTDGLAGYSSVYVDIPVQSKTGNDGISTITDVNVRPDSGYDYLTGVDVHIPTEAKTESYTLQGHNDQHTFNATSGYLMSSDTITLDYTANNITKTGVNKITTNDTYTVPSGYDGFGTIEVDVPGKPEEHGSHTFQANTTTPYRIEPTSGSVFDYVDVTVALPMQSKTGASKVTTNNVTVTPDNGYEGLSEVRFEYTPVLQTRTTAGNNPITANGTYTVPSGYDGFGTIEVDVPQNTVGVKPSSITANGTYPASTDNLDGYSSVTVAIPTEHGTGTFTTNTPSGTPTRITPTAGSYFDYVDITVNVPSIGYLEMTQAQYDALQVKDPNTIYLITD